MPTVKKNRLKNKIPGSGKALFVVTVIIEKESLEKPEFKGIGFYLGSGSININDQISSSSKVIEKFVFTPKNELSYRNVIKNINTDDSAEYVEVLFGITLIPSTDDGDYYYTNIKPYAEINLKKGQHEHIWPEGMRNTTLARTPGYLAMIDLSESYELIEGPYSLNKGPDCKEKIVGQ